MSLTDTIRQFSHVLSRQQMQYGSTAFKRIVTQDYDGLNLTVKVTSRPFGTEERVWETSFDHIPPGYCDGERCICGRLATHKVAEETEQVRHPFTAYLCCECFDGLFGGVAKKWCADSLKARQS